MSIIEPVYFLDQFVRLCSETNRLYVEVCEALVMRIYDKLLILESYHFCKHPSTEQLPVE